LPEVPGVLLQRTLLISVASASGQTVIRVDAQVTWLPAKPASERIPPAATVVTITEIPGIDQRTGRLAVPC
jgi:hypothetical protein